jgi:hypothetical protein
MIHKINVGYLDVHQFKCLWTLFSDDPRLITTAAQHALMYDPSLKLRNKKGISGDGRRVITDHVGAYSSGYILLDGTGNGYVKWPKDETFFWDDDPEENRRQDIRTKLAELRDA